VSYLERIMIGVLW